MSVESSGERANSEQASPETQVVNASPRRSFLRPTRGLVFALIGGGLTWLFLQATYPVFRIPEELANLGGFGVTAEQSAAQAAALVRADQLNAIFYLAILGALIGSGLSLAEVTKYPHTRAAALGGITVFITGGLFGAAGGFFGDLALLSSLPMSGEPLSLIATMLVQIITFGITGLGIGIGLSLYRGGFFMSLANRAPAGLLAGIFTGICYPVLASVLLPFAQTESTLPTGPFMQLLWVATAAGVMGLIIPNVAHITSKPDAGLATER